MIEEQEVHSRQFTGWWIPRHVVELLEQKILNAKEVLLLAQISGLSKSNEGCHASVSYLGQLLDTKETQTREMISHLLSLKLIRVVKFDGRRRWLEPWYDRPCQERTEVSGDQGNGIPETRATESRWAPQRNPVANSNSVIVIENMPVPNGTGSSVPSSPLKVAVPSSNGHSTKKDDTSLNSEFDKTAGDHLFKTLTENGSVLTKPRPPKRPVRPETLSKEISRLRLSGRTTEEEIKSVLVWYRKAYKDSFTPQFYKVRDIYDFWDKLKSAKARWDWNHNEEESDEASDTSYKEEFQSRKICANVRDYFKKKGITIVSTAAIKEALTQLGLDSKSISLGDYNAYGSYLNMIASWSNNAVKEEEE